MYANKYTVDGKLYFEATLIAVEEGGDPNQKAMTPTPQANQ